jgi:hypothetical protein
VIFFIKNTNLNPILQQLKRRIAMEDKLHKLQGEFARSVIKLFRRERKLGLQSGGIFYDGEDGLVQDYYQSEFDEDAVAQEYRQLKEALKHRNGDNADDTSGEPQRELSTLKRRQQER